MASLLTIPTELFDNILLHLPQRDLVSLCRTSKYAKLLTEPALYHEISWMGPNQKPLLLPLLCTLFNRPELCAHITHFTFLNNFHALYTLPDSSNLDHSRVSMTDSTTSQRLQQCADFVSTSSIPCKTNWIEWVQFGSVDCLLGLLVWQLPNLKVLKVHRVPWNGFDFVKTVFGYALCSKDPLYGLTRFQQLEQVDISPGLSCRWGKNKGSNTSTYQFAFFYLPGIKRLACNAEDMSHSWGGDSELTVLEGHRGLMISETLTSLDLRDVYRGKYIAFVISTASALRRLRLTLIVSPWTSRLDCSEFQLALSEGARKLEDVCIVLDNDKNHRINDDDVSNSLVIAHSISFQKFEKLHTLEIPRLLLFGQSLPGEHEGLVTCLSDVLPPSIEHLSLSSIHPIPDPGEPYYDYAAVRGAFEGWLDNWNLSTPKLKRITLYRLSFVEIKSFKPLWQEIRPLVDLCIKVGIEAEVRYTPETLDEMALRWAHSKLQA